MIFRLLDKCTGSKSYYLLQMNGIVCWNNKNINGVKVIGLEETHWSKIITNIFGTFPKGVCKDCIFFIPFAVFSFLASSFLLFIFLSSYFAFHHCPLFLTSFFFLFLSFLFWTFPSFFHVDFWYLCGSFDSLRIFRTIFFFFISCYLKERDKSSSGFFLGASFPFVLHY